MSFFLKLFNRKLPDGLLEICDRVYVFECCFSIDSWEEENYKLYTAGVVSQLQEYFPDASSLVFNFREVGSRSVMADVLSEHGLTIMDYPRHYEGCSVLPVEVMHHFLRSSESWLSLGSSNLLLMHCERGAWPVLAFMLAALLIYRKQNSDEYKALDMMYKQAPRELLHLFSPLNPIPSQIRYLQYVLRRDLVSQWPPLDRSLNMDCVILRLFPNVSGQDGFRPIFRVYGQDPLSVDDKKSKLLYSTPKKGKHLKNYKQAECELVRIDINCHLQGDIVIEGLSLNDDMEKEVMLFRVVFNTAFIRSNILMLDRNEVDTLWHIKEQFPEGFRVELIFSDMDAAPAVGMMDFPRLEGKDGLPVEAFSKVDEIFDQIDLLDQMDATDNMLQDSAIPNAVQEVLKLQELSQSIHDIMKPEAIEQSAKFELSSMSKLETGSAEDLHSVLQISIQANTTNEEATKLLPQESPSLNLVHHSPTVEPLDCCVFSENAPSPENMGEAVSLPPSPPHPARTSLVPTGAPPSPPPLSTMASQPCIILPLPAEPLSPGNLLVSLSDSTTPGRELPTTVPATPPRASHVFTQESSKPHVSRSGPEFER